MDCSPKIRDDSYNFLDTVEEYVKALEEINSVSLDSRERKDCEDFSKNHAKTYTEIGKNICEQFLKLYKYLPNIKNNITGGTCFKKECGFLNYWLNFELKKNNKIICINKFYNGIESYCGKTISNDLPLGAMYNIDQDHLNKIDKLYNLYANYTKLNNIIDSNWEENKQEILRRSLQCCTHYNDVSYMCNGDNENSNPKFCRKLNDFKLKYDKLDKKEVDQGSDFYDYFIKLEECPNNKIITTAVTGTVVGLIPLLGVLYKVSDLIIKLRTLYGNQ
ncbi:hypothetical protein PVBG_06277 [Plasmodium vivax Brazil I]|uniref:Uncharacterized protein n=1 Tax=Plasmodium vivax (strain Brazil I) TaxID=1033975 RepID=A0A0J9SK61_PLAV1|nr:hypothetical protein PVBG_06277 [Plasmodium vivax Brazil I]